MNKLQQRRQSYRRRQEAITNLRKAGRVAATILLLWFMWQLPSTRAYFSDRAETGPHTFRATTFGENLAISPGKSKTNNSPGNPGPDFDVAQSIAGHIYLDFGIHPAGNNWNFPQVLILSNISAERHLNIEWHFSGHLAELMEGQEDAITIAPGEVSPLGFKLKASPQAQPGEYLGTLHLLALDGFITAEMPARLRLAEKKDEDKDKKIKKDEKEGEDDKDKKAHNAGQQTVTGAVYGPPDSDAAKDSSGGKEISDEINAAPDKAGIDPAAPKEGKEDALQPQAEAGPENTAGQHDAPENAGVNPDMAEQEAAKTVNQNKPTAADTVAPDNQADSGGEKDANSNH